MKLTFLGVGGAFALKNFHSNMILEKDGKRLLIDAGTDIRFSLKQAGLGVKDLDAVYISHIHDDHMGGVPYLAFASYFIPPVKKIALYGTAATLRTLWDVIKPIVGSIQNKYMGFEDYFDVHMLSPKREEPSSWEGVGLQIIKTPHIFDGQEQMFSYGLWFTSDKGKKVYISTDTQAINALEIATADIIFHDCEIGFKSGVHTHYDDLKDSPPDIKKRIWLYHYGDAELPDAVADGFAGFVKQGQVFDL